MTLFIISGLLLIITEVIARFGLGLGNPPLFEISKEYGYRFRPNQNIVRFRNRIHFDSEGHRNEDIKSYISSNTIRIMCIGDSITYGGAMTDQQDTYPYLLADALNHNSISKYEVLGVSAPSWGVQNEEAYLRKHGVFNSHIVVLQIGSTDLYQPMSTSEVVGCLPQYPDRKPLLALQELPRYLLPRLNIHLSRHNCLKLTPKRPSDKILIENIASLKRIINFIRVQKAKIIVIFIEQPDNLEPRNYDFIKAKQEVVRLMREMNVIYINLQEAIRTNGGSKLFRDGLHPNESGNRIIAAALSSEIDE